MIRTRPSILAAFIAFTSLLALALLAAWRTDRRDRAQLAADLATANQTLAQAATRQHTRDAQLQQALAAIANQKRAVTEPAQVLRQLPKQIPLPTPITLQTPTSPRAGAKPPCSSGPLCGPEGLEPSRPSDSATSKTEPPKTVPAGQAVLAAEDLKPLYDFALDCKACQAKLTAAQADLSDEKAKTVLLTHERDEAVRVAKGGSVLRRITRAAKWFAIGAVAGALAAKARP